MDPDLGIFWILQHCEIGTFPTIWLISPDSDFRFRPDSPWQKSVLLSVFIVIMMQCFLGGGCILNIIIGGGWRDGCDIL